MISIPDKYRKYKELLEPKNYYPDLLTDYLYCKYNCKDITSTYRNKNNYKVIMDNLLMHFGSVDQLAPIILEIINDEKSGQLYQNHDESFIYVFLDKQSGFFDSNSNQIIYELTIEKSVSKEDYENESTNLVDALGIIYTEINGVLEEDIADGSLSEI